MYRSSLRHTSAATAGRSPLRGSVGAGVRRLRGAQPRAQVEGGSVGAHELLARREPVNPLFIGAHLGTADFAQQLPRPGVVSIPSSSRHISAPARLCLSWRRGQQFQSPLHRGTARHRKGDMFTIKSRSTFQSPLHRGISGTRHRGRLPASDLRVSIPSSSGHLWNAFNAKFEYWVIRFQSPLHRGTSETYGDGYGDGCGYGFQSPLHRGLPRNETICSTCPSCPPCFNPLFFGVSLETHHRLHQPNQELFHVSIPSSSGHISALYCWGNG